MDLQILARIAALQVEAFAVNAEIEGMKAENVARRHQCQPPTFGRGPFNRAAEDLRSIANELKVLGDIR